MKYFLIFFAAAAIACSVSTSCNKTPEYDFSQDSVRGLWGKVALYNEFGERLSAFDNVHIVAHVSDTTHNFSDNSLTVFDTTISTFTNAQGEWVFRKSPQGYYTIEMLKDGFGKNQIFQYHYDTTRADTLPTMYLAQRPQGSVRLNEVLLVGTILNISRTIFFVGTRNYALSTWYFFDTIAGVNSENYTYSYMSGAKNSDGLPHNTMTIQKPLDKLYSAGFREGQTVYVRAYADNYRYVRFQTGKDTWAYPNIVGESNEMQFTMPPMEIQ
ncbi:MAG: hypothetical protein LBU90_04185 [Bacteroidales bacterium]|jgi:hypothetical protein|nr:hypothetical protein [Bacteroidales bacterium]